MCSSDLAARAPRRSGLPRLRFADVVKHAVLAAQARREAETVLAADPDLARPEHAAAARALARRVAQDAVSAEGG